MGQTLFKVNPSSSWSWAWPSSGPVQPQCIPFCLHIFYNNCISPDILRTFFCQTPVLWPGVSPPIKIIYFKERSLLHEEPSPNFSKWTYWVRLWQSSMEDNLWGRPTFVMEDCIWLNNSNKPSLSYYFAIKSRAETKLLN